MGRAVGVFLIFSGAAVAALALISLFHPEPLLMMTMRSDEPPAPPPAFSLEAVLMLWRETIQPGVLSFSDAVLGASGDFYFEHRTSIADLIVSALGTIVGGLGLRLLTRRAA